MELSNGRDGEFKETLMWNHVDACHSRAGRDEDGGIKLSVTVMCPWPKWCSYDRKHVNGEKWCLAANWPADTNQTCVGLETRSPTISISLISLRSSRGASIGFREAVGRENQVFRVSRRWGGDVGGRWRRSTWGRACERWRDNGKEIESQGWRISQTTGHR